MIRVLVPIVFRMPLLETEIFRPAKRLEARGEISLRWCFIHDFRPEMLDSADALLLFRSSTYYEVRIALAARDRGIPVLYQTDDNFFDIPLDSAIGIAHRHYSQQGAMCRILQEAAMARVYSDITAAHIRTVRPDCERIDPYFDFGLVPPEPPPRPANGPVKIVYPTSRATEDRLHRTFLPAVRRLLEEQGPRVEFVFWGPPLPEGLRGLPNVRHRGFLRNYGEFTRAFSDEAFDVGLAPLDDDPFCNSKTNNKYREFGAHGIAGVFSDVPLYRSCIESGKNGVLVGDDTEAWYRALSGLVADRENTRAIAEAAHRDVRERYHHDRYDERLLADLRRLVAKGAPALPGPRVRSVYVYFHPEASAGTRRFAERFVMLLESVGVDASTAAPPKGGTTVAIVGAPWELDPFLPGLARADHRLVATTDPEPFRRAALPTGTQIAALPPGVGDESVYAPLAENSAVRLLLDLRTRFGVVVGAATGDRVSLRVRVRTYVRYFERNSRSAAWALRTVKTTRGETRRLLAGVRLLLSAAFLRTRELFRGPRPLRTLDEGY